MKLTILNVAFPFAPVGPDAVGGAEQILSRLDEYLVTQGHQSVVLACEGSVVAGTLLATAPVTGLISDEFRDRVHQQYQAMIRFALEQWPIDVVHFHGVDCHRYIPSNRVSVLVTLHCPVCFYEPVIFQTRKPSFFAHCVSASQRRTCPRGINLLPEIPNGVPQICQKSHPKGKFAIAIGRICPEKNFHAALEAAKRAKCALLLAGSTFPYAAHQTYYKQMIVPRLDILRRHIGPIGATRKQRLLSAARCLLLPSLVPETSSLVAMEALMCGTPVIAYCSGALPEIIEHGKTGFIVQDEKEMAEAINRIDLIDPEVCRATALARFSGEKMASKYLSLYRQLATNYA